MTDRRDGIFYFAYGSNMDPQRFRARVGPWRARLRGALQGYRLRFADQVRSEGGGGAVVDLCPQGRVDGVLFEIGVDQLEAMDREEFAPSRDRAGAGRRLRHTILTERGTVEAELYTVEDDGRWRAPSARYLGHILRGLTDAGYPPAALDAVREIAALAGRRSGSST